jgi:hypothetical protein
MQHVAKRYLLCGPCKPAEGKGKKLGKKQAAAAEAGLIYLI